MPGSFQFSEKDAAERYVPSAEKLTGRLAVGAAVAAVIFALAMLIFGAPVERPQAGYEAPWIHPSQLSYARR